MAPPRMTKKPPPKREKKESAKTSLQEVCSNMLADKLAQQREREDAVKRAQHRAEEDAMMELMYGPDWRKTAP